MSPRGDDDDGMKATRYLHDDAIEAIIQGEPVHDMHAPLVTFADRVRALGDEPVPAASPTLAAVLAGRVRLTTGPAHDGDVAVPVPGAAHGRKRMPGMDRAAGLTAKVASLGLVAKLGLGTSLAAAGVASAGAAGVLPAAANDAVRGAIEVVSPVEFGPADDSTNFGGRVSSDATGESDGENGVEGPDIADDAPGAAHRPDSGVVDELPGQSGETGLTRANETPAAPQAPDVAPSTVPDQAIGADAGDPDGDGVPGSRPATPPSTVPEKGGQEGD